MISLQQPVPTQVSRPAMQGLPANIFKSGVLRTANSTTRPAPSLFSFLGLRSTQFWDTTCTTTFPWANDLEKQVENITKEYQTHATTTPSDYETKADEHSLHHGEWEWRSFIKKGLKEKSFETNNPITTQALTSIPELQKDIPFAYSFFSTMKAGTRIDSHTAPCNIRLRGHLPLIVPDGDVCGITVGGITKQYEVGKLMIFDDAFPHETWHNGFLRPKDKFEGNPKDLVLKEQDGKCKDRVILLFDIWHPDLTFEERAAIVEMFEVAQQSQQQ